MATKIPPPPLSAFVDMLWYWEGYATGHALEHVLPTGTMELVFDLHGGAATVAGAASRFFTLETSRQAAVLGVHFKPGGGFPFFGRPAGELCDQNVTLADVWGRAARAVEDEVAAGTGPDDRFAVVERALLQAAKDGFHRHRAVSFALGEFERAPFADPVAVVAERAGLSGRRFAEAFRAEVGLTPKLFCRVKRFQAVIDCVGKAPAADWAGVAAHCGYFDQAHFIRDFREFAGFTPAAYLARRGEHKNHVPVA